MHSRREFLGQLSMVAGLLPLADLHPAQAAVPEARPTPDTLLLSRARALLKQAPLIDAHNDLAWMFLNDYANDISSLDMGQVQPKLCADIPRLREGGVGAQYWAIYVANGTQKMHTGLHSALRQFDVALRFIRSRPETELALTAADIERIHKSGRIASLLGVEGGSMIENSPAVLRAFHALGARYMTLTHYDNVPWADSANDRSETLGLNEFGKRIVREMNRIGMFVDISHVHATTMLDALSVTRAPVIFSHSNPSAIQKNMRNAPDEVLRLVPANGGVVHVTFIAQFVAPGNVAWQAERAAFLRTLHIRFETDAEINAALAQWEKTNPAPRGTIADVAHHIDHLRDVVGIDHIGIGADFFDSGNNSMVEGLDDVSRYPYLFAELLRRGYSDEDLLKIAGRNHLRAMRQMEAVAARLQKTEKPLTPEGPAYGLLPE